MKRVFCWLTFLFYLPLYCFALELSPLDKTPYHGDFNQLKERGVIRVLVAADLGFYYIEQGRPKGIIAELLYHFETQIKQDNTYLHLQVIPVHRDELIPSLKAGLGDLAVANLTITKQREKHVSFSAPMLTDIKEFIVTSKQRSEFTNIEQLSGEEIWVRPSSSYFESIQKINKHLSISEMAPIQVNFLEETIQDLDVIEMINQGFISATILDSHKTDLWLNIMDNIKIHQQLPLRESGKIGWAFRLNSPELEKIVNSFLRTAKSGTLLGNVLHQKYIEKTKWLDRLLNPNSITRVENLSSLFEKYSMQYEFDWLMISAQAFQESGLDNRKVSHKGAIGIMQVLPSTAKDPYIDIHDISKLENNIHAGVKYMRFIKDRYFSKDNISYDNQVYLSLASYNAGPAKIRKMRQLAKKQGYNPNIWFKNVEVITRKNVGTEPIKYVANINRYYVIYKQMMALKLLKATQNTPENKVTVME